MAEIVDEHLHSREAFFELPPAGWTDHHAKVNSQLRAVAIAPAFWTRSRSIEAFKTEASKGGDGGEDDEEA